MYEVIIKSFEGADVRVVNVNDKPWFVALDVCNMLGLGTNTGGTYRHIHTLDNSEIKRISKAEANVTQSDVSFPNRGVNAISESGLYKLVMRSNKPDAKPFQDWVTKVVLPAIRKDGGYIVGEEKVVTGEMSEDEFILKAMTMMQGKVERLTKERDEAQATVKEQMPKADFADRMTNGMTRFKLYQVAKRLGVTVPLVRKAMILDGCMVSIDEYGWTRYVPSDKGFEKGLFEMDKGRTKNRKALAGGCYHYTTEALDYLSKHPVIVAGVA